MSQLNKRKEQHLQQQKPSMKFSWVREKLGGEDKVISALWKEGGSLWVFLRTPRSSWQECVNFSFFQPKIKDPLRMTLFTPLFSSRVHKVTQSIMVWGVKRVICQNKINNERTFLWKVLEKKMFTANQPACGDSKHSRAWLQFGLAIICHSCDNACWLQVCGWPHRVYLEMNLKSVRTGKAHNPVGQKKKKNESTHCSEWGAVGGSPKLLRLPQWVGMQTQA